MDVAAKKGSFLNSCAIWSSAFPDLVDAGIIDPTKVVRIALENAVSVASTLLLTEATMTRFRRSTPRPPIDRLHRKWIETGIRVKVPSFPENDVLFKEIPMPQWFEILFDAARPAADCVGCAGLVEVCCALSH